MGGFRVIAASAAAVFGFLLPWAPAENVVETAVAAEAPVGVECDGDECQGPAPAPEDPTPATAVVEGPPNPPVRFPKSHPKKHHHRVHHRHRGSR